MPSPIHALPFLMSAALAAPAPGTWRALNDNWSEPLKAHFADARHGWATGHQGIILRTGDGGASWDEIETGYPENYEIDFIDGIQGWALGDSTLLATRDGGKSWTRLARPASPSKAGFDFVDPLAGFLRTEEGVLFATVDGGLTWTERWKGDRAIRGVWAFGDARHGLAKSGRDTLLMTRDGGVTWMAVKMDDLPGNDAIHVLTSITFLDPKTAWVSAANRRYHVLHYLSRNGGVTWIPQSLAPKSRFEGIKATEGKWIGAVAKTGDEAAWSLDGGRTWSLKQKAFPTPITAVQFTDARTGWVSGANHIHATRDGGATWKVSRNTMSRRAYLVAGHFPDKNTGWVADHADGVIYKTTDGGRIWHQHAKDSAQWMDMDFHDDRVGAAVGSPQRSGPDGHVMSGPPPPGFRPAPIRGAILSTRNGGANWIRFELPPSERPQAVHFPTARIGFVVSHHEESKTMRIHMSDDSGLTWKGEDTGLPIDPSAIQFLDPGMGWVLGTIEKSESCAAYLTKDGGKSWSRKFTSEKCRGKEVQFIDARHGWMGTWKGLFRTADGGETWTQCALGQDHGFGAFRFKDAKHGWASLHYGRNAAKESLFHTADGGATWIGTKMPGNDLSAIRFTPAGEAWAVGSRGTVLKLE
jgi:photosystem II stability/assembly factor-like uncharacterized protein